MKNPLEAVGVKRKKQRSAAYDYYTNAVTLDTDRFIRMAAEHAREILAGRPVGAEYLRDAEDVAAEILDHSRDLRDQMAAELAVIRMRDRVAVEALRQLTVAQSAAMNSAALPPQPASEAALTPTATPDLSKEVLS